MSQQPPTQHGSRQGDGDEDLHRLWDFLQRANGEPADHPEYAHRDEKFPENDQTEGILHQRLLRRRGF